MPELILNYATIEEVPEDMRQFCAVADDKITYNPDGLLSAVQKERKAAADAKRALDEALKAKEQTQQQHQPEKKEQKIDPLLAEYEKRVKALEETLAKQQKQALQDKKTAFMAGIANECNMHTQAARLIEDQISLDEQGFFVKDLDGSPKIGADGRRISPKDHVESLKRDQSWSWMFKSQAQSPQTTSGRPPQTKTVTDQLMAQAEEAMKKGDTKTQIAILRKLNRQ